MFSFPFPKAFVILSLVLVSACGGGGDKSPSEPKANSAPVARADIAKVNDDQSITINVLGNDSDVDGDQLTILAIVASPILGEARIQDGQIIYTPNQNQAGIDSLSYEVSDGNLSSEATVEVSVVQSLRIGGTVTPSLGSGTQVQIENSGTVYSATADENGDYEISLELLDLNEIMHLTAIGNGSNDQPAITLTSIVGSGQKFFASLFDGRFATGLNITPLSTARSFLLSDMDTPVDSQETLERLLQELNLEALVYTGSVINLIVEHDDYPIPQGESLDSLLNDSQVSVLQQIDDYIEERALLTEEWNFNETATSDLYQSISDVAEMFESVIPLTSQLMAEKSITEYQAPRGGLLQHSVQTTYFDIDGTSVEFPKVENVNAATRSWSVSEGKLLQEETSLTIHRFAWYGLSQSDIEKFGEDANVQVKAWLDAGALVFGPQLEKEIDLNTRFIALEQQNGLLRGIRQTTRTQRLLPPINQEWSGAAPEYTETYAFLITYRTQFDKITDGLAVDDISGQWAIPLIVTNAERGTSGIEADMAQFNPDVVSMEMSGKQFSWSMQDGVLTLQSLADNQLDERYEIFPYAREEIGLQVQVKHFLGEEVHLVYSGIMAKVDSSADIFLDEIATELPVARISLYYAWQENNWTNDQLDLDAVYGYQFDQSGGITNGIFVSNSSNGVFTSSRKRWTYAVESGKIFQSSYTSFSALNDYKYEHQWTPITSDSDGNTLILEYKTEGFVGEEPLVTIPPRISTTRPVDLSEYGDAWALSELNVDGGAGKQASPKSSKGLNAFRRLMSKAKNFPGL